MKQNLNILKERSGSCGIIVLIVDQTCFVANVGDSRAIMSMNQGQTFVSLSTDHKPENPSESKRIIENGGQIYRHTQPGLGPVGPKRVLPGRLSVSRTFGDASAKIESYGGKPGIVVAEPEISQFPIHTNKHDFILLGCDGIFDKLTTEEAGKALYDHTAQEKAQMHERCRDKPQLFHEESGKSVEKLMLLAMKSESLDNLSVVLITLPNYQNYLTGQGGSPKASQARDLSSSLSSFETQP